MIAWGLFLANMVSSYFSEFPNISGAFCFLYQFPTVSASETGNVGTALCDWEKNSGLFVAKESATWQSAIFLR